MVLLIIFIVVLCYTQHVFKKYLLNGDSFNLFPDAILTEQDQLLNRY